MVEDLCHRAFFLRDIRSVHHLRDLQLVDYRVRRIAHRVRNLAILGLLLELGASWLLVDDLYDIVHVGGLFDQDLGRLFLVLLL